MCSRNLHSGDPKPITKRRMHRHNGIIRRQCISPKGPLRDREAHHHRIGKQAAKADGDTVFPVALKKISRGQKPRKKAGRRARVKTHQQCRIKTLTQIKPSNRLKEQRRDREILCVLHDRVDHAIRKQRKSDSGVSRPDHKKNWQDNVEKRLHFRPLAQSPYRQRQA